MTDLIAAAQAGDRAALAELLWQLEPRIYRFALRIVRSEEDAADVTQDTLLSVVNKLGTYEPERARITTWALAIARYRAIDVRRRQAREPIADMEHHPEVMDQRPDAEQRLEVESTRAMVREAVADLPETYRADVIAVDFRGLTHQQRAAEIGAPIGTVLARVHRGRKMLRARLA